MPPASYGLRPPGAPGRTPAGAALGGSRPADGAAPPDETPALTGTAVLAGTAVLWERYRTFTDLVADPELRANPLMTTVDQPACQAIILDRVNPKAMPIKPPTIILLMPI